MNTMSLGFRHTNKLVMVAFLLFGLVLGAGGPANTEARLFPVAGNNTGFIVSETESELCWVLRFDKYRDASPKFFTWVLTLDDGSRHFLPVYRKSAERHLPTSRDTSRKGESANFINCATKPDGVSSIGPHATLSAYSEYLVWHGLWSVPRVVPPFNARKHEYGKKDKSR